MESSIGIETRAMPINMGIEAKDREEIVQVCPGCRRAPICSTSKPTIFTGT